MTTTPPPTNSDVNDIADRAKHGYAKGTDLLAVTQYRLAELSATGRLDPEESTQLQQNLIGVWDALYFGTVSAVRDRNTDDCTWDAADNTYSDGREVRTLIQVEPVETEEDNWEFNPFLSGDGAVADHPRGSICGIAPMKPDGDRSCT
jgi:hypothetical protein